MCSPYYVSPRSPMAALHDSQEELRVMKALKPHAGLAAVVGAEPMPRAKVTKRPIEAGSRRTTCKTPANKRNVLCDSKLKAVIGKDKVTMFGDDRPGSKPPSDD